MNEIVKIKLVSAHYARFHLEIFENIYGNKHFYLEIE